MIWRTPLLVLALATALGTLHCGGTTTSTAANDGGTLPDGTVTPPGPPPANLPPPTAHRVGGASCPTTRPAGLNDDAGAGDAGFPGACTADAQCTNGKNGRCLPPNRGGPHVCSYDACAVDDDCGAGKLCTCGVSLGTNGSDGTPMRTGNVCLPGNCRIDGDCGAGGYCSPTFDTSCGPYSGVQGYYCHTSKDDCTNDDQCNDGRRGGYCAWQPPLGKWACAYTFCAG